MSVSTLLQEKMDAAAKVRETRRILTDQLEYDVTGLVNAANLTFDQLVQYSIAMSLKMISNRLDGAKALEGH